jgi:hypothetical protein
MIPGAISNYVYKLDLRHLSAVIKFERWKTQADLDGTIVAGNT